MKICDSMQYIAVVSVLIVWISQGLLTPTAFEKHLKWQFSAILFLFLYFFIFFTTFNRSARISVFNFSVQNYISNYQHVLLAAF